MYPLRPVEGKADAPAAQSAFANGPTMAQRSNGTGDDNAEGDEHGEIDGKTGARLTYDKKGHGKKEEPFRCHAARCQHEGQGKEPYKPGVERDHDARVARRHAEGLGNIKEQAMGINSDVLNKKAEAERPSKG